MIRVEMSLNDGTIISKIHPNAQQAEAGISELKLICREYQLSVLSIEKLQMEE